METRPGGTGLASAVPSEAPLATVGSLLRAWRRSFGWTQGEVATTLRVSRAAVASWEADVRRISAEALADLDFGYSAEGCLIDLVRAIDSPWAPARRAGRRSGEHPVPPRRRWGHVYDGDPGPTWVWIRPATGDRVAGHTEPGPLGVRFDRITGPDGLFVTLPYATPRLPLLVRLSELGWVDFGRGEIPTWLDLPARVTGDIHTMEPLDGCQPMVAALERALLARDRGMPATLRERMRDLVDPDRWDRWEEQYDGCTPPGAGLPLALPTDPSPPATSEERIALHVRLRRARGMSHADAAAAATAVLAGAGEKQTVSRQQIRNYEEGRGSRIAHLPALVDQVYAAFGWTCHEPVATARVGAGTYDAAPPEWWTGPVTVTATPTTTFPSPGEIVLVWRNRRCAHPLPDAIAAAALSVETIRMPDELPLRVQVPPGWRIDVHLGHTPTALDVDQGWRPVDDQAADRFLDLPIWLRLLGRTGADLQAALRPGAPRRPPPRRVTSSST